MSKPLNEIKLSQEIEASDNSNNPDYLIQNGIDFNHGISLLGEKSMYDETLKDFLAGIDERMAKLKEYKIPIIPNSYFIEFKEADEAIREIVKEINKKPIVIKILNIRVDTARDLVFKIYNKTNDMVKTVMLCERLIVYGNRYRSSYQEVDVNLDEATDLFNRGQYKKSLDILVSTLSEIDTSIKDKFEIN